MSKLNEKMTETQISAGKLAEEIIKMPQGAEKETKQLELNKLLAIEKNIGSQIVDIQKQKNNLLETAGKKIDAELNTSVKYEDAMIEGNRIFESFLGTQRTLMESAMFGLGASVSMMQKQVDLAQKNIALDQSKLNSYKETLQFLKEEEIERLATAGDSEDLQKAAADIAGRLGKNDQERERARTDTSFSFFFWD